MAASRSQVQPGWEGLSCLSPGVQGSLKKRDFFPAGLFWIKQRWLSSLSLKSSGQLLVLPHFLPTHAEDTACHSITNQTETWSWQHERSSWGDLDISQQHLGRGLIDVEAASNSHVWKERFGTVPSSGSSAGQMVAVMDVGGVSNCTLGDVKAVQHLTEVFLLCWTLFCVLILHPCFALSWEFCSDTMVFVLVSQILHEVKGNWLSGLFYPVIVPGLMNL